MIQAFQRFSKSPIAKAFLIVVALSFGAFFGGSQYFGRKSPVVAEVGNMKISFQSFRMILEQERRSFEAQTDQSVTLEQLAQSGYANSVLEGMISRALLDQEANKLGLVVSDMDVLDTIHEQKMFQNESGQFDRDLFDRTLYSSHMTEDMYVEEIRSELMRRQLTGAVMAGSFAPKILSDSLLESQLQIRQGATVTLEPKNMTQPANPGDEVLEAFYTEQQDMFMQPELRSFTALLLGPEQVMGDMDITEDDIRAEYEATKEEYGDESFAEVKGKVRKTLTQQLAADKLYELSQQIDDEIAGGATLEEIGKDYKLVTVEGVTLAGSDKDGSPVGKFVPDPSMQAQMIAEAFSTEEGLDSTFVETTAGEYFVVRVDRVQSERPLDFAEIKDRVFKEWAYGQQIQEAYKNAEKIAQGINLGTSIPGTLSLLPNISLATPQTDVPEEIVSLLYTLTPGKAAVSPSNDGFVVVMLRKIIPPSNQLLNAEREKSEAGTMRLLRSDVLQSYENSLRIRYPVSINRKAVEAAVGR